MDNKEQVASVKKALDLSNLIIKYKEELEGFNSEAYNKPVPVAPTKVICKGIYPDAKAFINTKTNWKIFLIVEGLFLLAIIIFNILSSELIIDEEICGTIIEWLVAIALLIFPIIYFIKERNRKNNEVKNVENSESYRQACAQAERERIQKQKVFDEEYRVKLEKYNNYTLPNYEKEKADCLDKFNAERKNTEFKLSNVTDVLNKHYEETNLIPMQYRDIPALEYIYSIVSTSDFTVKEAIVNYDRKNERLIQTESLYEQKKTNELLSQQNQLRAEQNKAVIKQNNLLREQNEIANKTRAATENSAHQQQKINDEIERLEREAGLRW